MSTNKSLLNQHWFWGNEQAAEGLPFGNPSQTRL